MKPMKPLRQIAHILKYQILQNPIMYGLVIFMVFNARGSVDGVWKYDCLGWEQYPSLMLSFFALYFSWICFFGISGSASVNSAIISITSPFIWTRALNRRMIFVSQILLYSGLLIILLWPAIVHLAHPMKPLQMSFQSLQDNAAFQQALLGDPRLGAWQFYDKWKRIIIEVPHGREYQIGLWIYQNLATALILLWLGMGLRGAQSWKKFLPFLIILPVLGFSFVNLHYVTKLSENHNLSDLIHHGGQFVFYANYHLWLWIGLAVAALLIFWSIARNYLLPS